jgi:hypothetical protein
MSDNKLAWYKEEHKDEAETALDLVPQVSTLARPVSKSTRG